MVNVLAHARAHTHTHRYRYTQIYSHPLTHDTLLQTHRHTRAQRYTHDKIVVYKAKVIHKLCKATPLPQQPWSS